MKKKIVAILTLLVMLTAVFLFVGCVKTKTFEAVIYDHDILGVKEEFLKKNRTYGAYYINENGETVQDTTSPKTRTFVLSNNDDCLDSIGDWKEEVDFNKEVLILYLFTDTHHHAIPYWLTDVSVKNKALRIGITLHQVPREEDYIVPAWQRSILVRMEKVNFETVEFYEVTENTNPKNAVLYDDGSTQEAYFGRSYFREDFLEENIPYQIFYSKYGYFDKTVPYTYTHIVKNQEEYDKIFDDFIDVDFGKETLVVYVFVGTLMNYRITDIVLENSILKINYMEVAIPSNIFTGAALHQRCFVLKMDKTEFDTVKFIKVQEFYENIVKPFEE